MQTLRLVSAVGARPNFMKIAPFLHALDAYAGASPEVTFHHTLVHTGQHYDANMSETFFRSLGIPPPDFNLGVGSGSHAEQVGKTMMAFEKVVAQVRPDWVIVLGDVNATCACSITAKKQGVRLAHIEAGLRSFDLGMPEEINRIVTDRLSDLLFTPDELSSENLRREGVAEERIQLVGNIMIDTLEAGRATASAMAVEQILPARLVPDQRVLEAVANPEGLSSGFSLLTLHRPSNVDNPDVLRPLVHFLVNEVAATMPLVWTIHPRTRSRLEAFGLWPLVQQCPAVILVEPLDYFEMLCLSLSARLVITDSGGLQEECCVLGTPCLTLRDNTERPVTLEQHGGVSRLVGNDVARVRAGFHELRERVHHPFRPPLWDGHTGARIVAALAATV